MVFCELRKPLSFTWMSLEPIDMKVPSLAITLLLCSFSLPLLAAEKVTGIAMHGGVKYAHDFNHFDYVNPDAPKGGTIKLHSIGSFDSLHPFVSKGNPAAGIGLIYDTLTVQSYDEAFSQYGLLAESMEIPEDRSWVIYHINPLAKFSDEQPVTAVDVEFSFQALITKGTPLYRSYYADVDKVTVLGTHSIRFDFKPGVNRELALILGQLPVFPKHFWKDRDFSKPTQDIPVASGPYVVDSFQVNKSITYKRNPEYWGKDLAVNTGKFNFDYIRYDYFLDPTAALEAFKSGTYDYRAEHSSKRWATEYTFPAAEEGQIVVEEVPHEKVAGMQAFVYNLRRPYFQNPLVRKALAYAFDFEWSNKHLFFSAYERSNSFFANSELGSRGLPTKEELIYLESLKDSLPKEVFSQEYKAPVHDGSGQIRGSLKKAVQLLRNAGWSYKGGMLVNNKGELLTFEILIVSPTFERIINPFIKNLKRLGVTASLRLVERSQYINRLRSFDFDMVVSTFAQSASPGNEQWNYWSTESAEIEGSNNLMGIQNPAIDQLIENVVSAKDRQQLVYATRALDRALLWNHYVIPQWHTQSDRIAYWNYLKRPKVTTSKGVNFTDFWFEE